MSLILYRTGQICAMALPKIDFDRKDRKRI